MSSIKCPNGCKVLTGSIAHICKKHLRHVASGEKFVCKIKNCSAEESSNVK